jgi:hypothetical protein
LDHRLLVKLVQDRDGPDNVIKGVGERPNDGHDSQLIIEIGESEGGRGKWFDDPDLLIHPVDECLQGFRVLLLHI